MEPKLFIANFFFQCLVKFRKLSFRALSKSETCQVWHFWSYWSIL